MSLPTPGVLFARSDTWRRAIAEARRAVDLMPSPEDRAVGERVIAALTAKAEWDRENP